jgi:hypothetical protein
VKPDQRWNRKDRVAFTISLTVLTTLSLLAWSSDFAFMLVIFGILGLISMTFSYLFGIRRRRRLKAMGAPEPKDGVVVYFLSWLIATMFWSLLLTVFIFFSDYFA